MLNITNSQRNVNYKHGILPYPRSNKVLSENKTITNADKVAKKEIHMLTEI